MKTFFAVIGFVVVALIVGTCVACNDDNDRQSLGRTFNKQVASLKVLAPAATFVASHERSRCYENDCDDGGYEEGDGGDGGYSGGHQGYGGGGGRSGDNDQRGDHNCRNFCFYGVPLPGQGGDQPSPKEGSLV